MGLLTLNRANEQGTSNRGPGISPRLLIALAVALFSIIGYFMNTSYNPVTEEKQHISISKDQEIALGLQARPAMERQYGGGSRDMRKVALVKEVGADILAKTAASKTDYKFDFHLLADPKTINAFALPGGQVFITEGLLKHLETRGQLAGVLAHEIGHVVARHSAEHIAKQNLTQGLTGATVIATYDPYDPRTRGNAQLAALVGSLVTLKFTRSDELEADKIGVKFCAEAGYDPRSMIRVMEILRDNAGKNGMPEFFNTHPNPENRIGKINQIIAQQYPNGVPAGLAK
ncbi:MAG: M48 family metallopeptidase [Leptolyngbya sp.]|nr:M48 family metallopeptidase [Candidatus Melainabacteria bacterium]